MRRFAIPLTAALALALGGCWISEEPLMPASAKDMPQLGDRYSELNPDGTRAGLGSIEVVDGEIHLTLERGTELKQLYSLRFDHLFDNWYLVQAIPEDQDNPDKMSFFRLVRQQGDHWLEFDPDCSEEVAKLDGVERSGGTARSATMLPL